MSSNKRLEATRAKPLAPQAIRWTQLENGSMPKLVFLVSLFWAATAAADVDDHFGNGALSAAWGSTLQSVQAMHPGGTTWPHKEEDGIVEVVYAVPGNFSVPSTNLRSALVHFVFTKENELQRVFFHLRFDDREAALFDIAQVLGQDYAVRDEGAAQVFSWKGKSSFAKFEVSSNPAFAWCFFGVRSMTIEPGGKR